MGGVGLSIEKRRTKVNAMIDIDTLIHEANDFEPLPESVTRLVALLGEDDVDAKEIEQVFALDGALTAKLLRQANSAASGSQRTIGTVSAAIVRLGRGSLMAMAVAAAAQKQLARTVEGSLWIHARTARYATELLRRHCQLAMPVETETAALLHDIGKVVLARHLDEKTTDLLERAARQYPQDQAFRSEKEILNVHHGEVGALIAQHWDLPDSIVRGILYHHEPYECVETDSRICHVVCVANWLAHRAACERQADADTLPKPPSVDELGISSDQVDQVVAGVIEMMNG